MRTPTDANGSASLWKGAGEFALVFLGFAALTAVLTYPLAFHPSTLVYRPANGDGQFSIWNVAWVARALRSDPLHVLDANIFYPHRGTLAYSEVNLAAGALAVPVYWATGNAYAAHNTVVLLSFVLSATGMYYLARHLVQDRVAATVSAICFAFCPHIFAHLLHIQLLMTAGLPFSLLAFHRLADDPTAGRAVVLGLVMAGQAFACQYYAVFVMLIVGWAVVVTAAWRHRWTDLRYWRSIGLAAFVAIMATVPVAWPYVVLQRESGFNRALGAARQYSADWRAYLASAALAQDWMLHYLGHWQEVLFPGFVPTALGLAGIGLGWRAGGKQREIVALYASLAVLAMWASFGPDAGLYRVLYAVVPAFSFMRAPSRFGLVVVLGLSVLSALAVRSLLSRLAQPALVAALLIVLAIADHVTILSFEPAPTPQPVYRELATLPYGAVLELPVYSRLLAHLREEYMLGSTVHWKPLVDAYSDYIPPDFVARAEVLGQFPTREGFLDLERDQVRYAVFHIDKYPRDMRAELFARLHEFQPYLRPLYADDRALLYEIVGTPP